MLLLCPLNQSGIERTTILTQRLFGQSEWWKFDSYEVDEDYVRPAPGARLEKYDPWELLDERAYVELANLATGPETPTASTDQHDRIRRWCESYGALGLLMQRTHVVRLAPQWSGRNASGMRVANQTIHYRVGGRWESGEAVIVSGPDRPLSPGPAPDRSGEVIIEEIWGGSPNAQRLGLTWWRYFPSVGSDEQDRYQYPLPASDEFWRLYAEPTVHFLTAASVLRDAIAAGGGDALEWSLDRLNGLASTARVIAVPDDDGLAQRWVAPSLIGVLGLMALTDLTGGVVPARCDASNCSNLFVPKRWWGAYCSDRCKHREQKRRQRANAKLRTGIGRQDG